MSHDHSVSVQVQVSAADDGMMTQVKRTAWMKLPLQPRPLSTPLHTPVTPLKGLHPESESELARMPPAVCAVSCKFSLPCCCLLSTMSAGGAYAVCAARIILLCQSACPDCVLLHAKYGKSSTVYTESPFASHHNFYFESVLTDSSNLVLTKSSNLVLTAAKRSQGRRVPIAVERTSGVKRPCSRHHCTEV